VIDNETIGFHCLGWYTRSFQEKGPKTNLTIMRLARFQRPDVWGWSAFNRLTNLRDELDRLFESPLEKGNSGVFNTWAPAIDVQEDNENLIVRAELPGLKRENIDISLHENTVTISGERKKVEIREGAKVSREERSFGRFVRSLSLPKQVDTTKAKATYKDGILTVSLPKSEEAKPRQIEIQN
jgi:HSP20 family protein